MENSMVKVDVTCRVGHFGLIEVRSGSAMRSAGIASLIFPCRPAAMQVVRNDYVLYFRSCLFVRLSCHQVVNPPFLVTTIIPACGGNSHFPFSFFRVLFTFPD
jgi:hypothetical protein